MTSPADFVHLHVHSDYSLIDGAAKTEALAKAAKKNGQIAVALTDHGSVSGTIDFWKACNKEDVKPLIGCEAYLAPGLDDLAHTRRGIDKDGNRIEDEKGKKKSHDYDHFTLIAKNLQGWHNLRKLASIASLEGFYYRPRMSWALLTKYHEGLIALSGCLSGQLSNSLKVGKPEQALAHARRWKELFGDDYYVELQPVIEGGGELHQRLAEDQAKANDGCLAIARQLDIKTVATADVHYVDPDESAIQEVKICVNSYKTLDENRKSGLNMPPVFYFKSSAEMQSLFRHYPQAALATREIADKCEKIKVLPGKYFLPKFITPDGSSSVDYFRRLCWEGLVRRYGAAGSFDVAQRLQYEMDCIEKMGFVDYFLVTQDFTTWARKHGVPVGPGRGSAAGSVVSYCLGITNIDPLRYGLLFERFLNPERVSMPDIDIDFCLAGDTLVMDSETGDLSTLRDLCQQQASPVVHALGSDLKLRSRKSAGVVFRGRKPVFELTTESGRKVTATGNHKFRTADGWKRLDSMNPGDMIASARALPVESRVTRDARELILIAGLVTESDTCQPTTLTFTSKKSPELLADFESAVGMFKRTHASRYVDANGVTKLTLSSGPNWRSIKDSLGCETLRCDAFEWAESLGLLNKKAHEKALPEFVFKLRDRDLELLVGRLWSGDGGLFNGANRIPSYTTVSEVLAQQVQAILLRLGIATSVLRQPYVKPDGEPRVAYRVYLYGDEALEAFHARVLQHVIESPERKQAFRNYVAERSARSEYRASPVDFVPVNIRSVIEDDMRRLRMGKVDLARRAGVPISRLNVPCRKRPRLLSSRATSLAVGEVLDRTDLRDLGSSDVIWETIKSITPAGEQDTYDIVDVDVDMNFALANGLIAHNCERGRPRVIEYVRQKYGEKCVAQIITFGESKAKSAIRDVGRVLDMPIPEVNKIAKLIPEDPKAELQDCLDTIPELKIMAETSAEKKRLFELALGLEGLYRSEGKHAAGVVIGDTDLMERIPLKKVGKGDEAGICTAFSMEQVEEVGLLKMDFLGLRTITQIYDTISLIKATTGKEIDPDAIPVRDNHSMETTRAFHRCPIHEVGFGQCRCCDKALEIFRHAETNGVFQVESGGMRKLLKQMRPDRFDDIVAIMALFRPGPLGSGMDQTYVKRKNGEEAVTYEHPKLEPILKETYGQFIYQESLMQLSVALAGFTLPQADELRKATAKKKPEAMAKIKDKFIPGCVKHSGLTLEHATAIWDKIVFFSEYSFNKSHSAAYGLISWQTAWLKANYPVEFFAALLTSWAGSTDKLALYVEELRRFGIPLEPPDINESESNFKVRVGPTGEKVIVYGLDALKGVGSEAIRSIVESRARVGRFTSIFHFCESVDLKAVTSAVLDALAKSGAFRSTGATRAQILESVTRLERKGRGALKEVTENVVEAATRLAKLEKKDRASGQQTLFKPNASDSVDKLPEVEEWTLHQALDAEREALGLYLTGHPLEEYADELAQYATVMSARVSETHDAEGVIMGGVVRAIRKHISSRGEEMAFITLEDMSGKIDAVAFPAVWERDKELLKTGRVLFLKGDLDTKREIPSLKIGFACPMDEARTRLVDPATVLINFWHNVTTEADRAKVEEVLAAHPGTQRVFHRWWFREGDYFTPQKQFSHRVKISRSFKEDLRAALSNRASYQIVRQ